MHPLVIEAMKKAAVAWLTVGDARPYPVWCMWQDDALYVVSGVESGAVSGAVSESSDTPRGSRQRRDAVPEGPVGPGEQPAPGLATATEVLVTARGASGGRIVSWPARVVRVPPDSELWQQVVPQLAGKRLNLPAAEDTAARWAAECLVTRLEPAGDPVEAGDTLPGDSLAAPPPESPAARRTTRPFRLHRVRGASRR